jgi:hypothetical protein
MTLQSFDPRNHRSSVVEGEQVVTAGMGFGDRETMRWTAGRS